MKEVLMANELKVATFILSIVVYTGVLIWGLKMIHKSMENKLPDMLSEKTGSKAGTPSFSRLAGAVGTMGLAAALIGVGYWSIYTLFADGDLSRLQGLSTYFLSGSALFAPYAFNQLSGIFK
jgi:hypothetical protein